ncbi:MAG: sulfatase [Nibricoccus sp.]
MSSLKPLLVLGSLFGAAFVTAAEPARPNVLFIVVDDLRTTLGCYGDPVAITPAIDALAARGTRFDAAYCQQAVCGPSRASLLTGRRPDTLRVWDLTTHFRTTTTDVVTLPQYFKQHGYHTIAAGKIFHDGRKMNDLGSWSEEPQLDGVRKQEDYRLPDNRDAGPSGKAAPVEFVDAPEGEYPDGRTAEAAIALLKQRAREPKTPFFLAVGFRKPHLPFTAPKKYWDLYTDRALPPVAVPEAPVGAPAVALHDSVELRGYAGMPARGKPFNAEQIAELRRGYYAATSFTDAQVGRVLAALAASGLEKNTIVVLFTDHGFHLGEHGLWVKTTNYEADTRVPLIIAPPGGKPGVTAALSELLDLYPTLADLSGLPPPEGVEGRSLRPWIEDPTHAGRKAAFSQFPRPWMMKGSPEIMGYAVRTATHRYIEWRDWTKGDVVARELYALEKPGDFETVNLVGKPDEAARERELSTLLPTAVAHEKKSASPAAVSSE